MKVFVYVDKYVGPEEELVAIYTHGVRNSIEIFEEWCDQLHFLVEDGVVPTDYILPAEYLTRLSAIANDFYRWRTHNVRVLSHCDVFGYFMDDYAIVVKIEEGFNGSSIYKVDSETQH